MHAVQSPAPYAGISRIRFNGFAGRSGISGPAQGHPKVCATNYPRPVVALQVPRGPWRRVSM